jgi:thioredoxin reductase (NADPH)
MRKATILAVDDDRAVLNSVERDLRQKYGRDYRIIKADSGVMGLDVLQQHRQRGETVALFVVDQRMPQLNGVEFLEQATGLFPEARKVLLTAYADTEAAIRAINQVGVDYYLMKPWDPPEEQFYPVIDGLLEEWQRNVRLPFEGIRVVGAMWSSECHDVKDFLARNTIPYLWLDIENSKEARQLLESADKSELKVPVLFFPDGSHLVAAVPSTGGKKGRFAHPGREAILRCDYHRQRTGRSFSSGLCRCRRFEGTDD